MLNIQLLGKTALYWNGTLMETPLVGKNLPLLYLLLQCESHFLTRDKLACYLWPDSAEDAAKYNLRYNLWQIKKILPSYGDEHLVIAWRDGCVLNNRYPWQCDLAVIKALQVESCNNQELLTYSQLFSGEVMDGWYLKNCAEFNDLLLLDRMICRRKQVDLLYTLAKRYQEEGCMQLCLDTLHKVSAVEPDNEDVAQAIMEAYVELGNRIEAIRFYKQFEGTLWNDLNITPNEKLRLLYNRLRTGESTCQARFPKENSKDVLVIARGNSQIRGWLLAEILTGLLETIDEDIIFGLEPLYLQDLCYISARLQAAYEKHTKSTQIGRAHV